MDRAHGLLPETQLDSFEQELEALQPGKTVAPADTDLWRLENLNQAIGTVVWAHQMGDTVFEQTGRTMVKRVLSGF